MALDLKLNQRLDLQLRLAPQIIQSIEILQLPGIELENLIQEHLDNNEFLDVVPTETISLDAPSAPAAASAEPIEVVEGRVQELGHMEAVGAFDDEMPRGRSSLNYEASDRKLEAMNNTAGRGPSLQDNLLMQLSLIEMDERLRPLAEAIITYLSPSGRLDVPFSTVLQGIKDSTFSETDAEHALDAVQSLEPKGIGARSIEECFVLQLDHDDPKYDLKRRLIVDYFDDLAKNRRPKITKELEITMAELDELVDELSVLTHQPGRLLVDDPAHHIYPDVIVDWTPDGYDVRLASNSCPQLRVNPVYRKVMQEEGVPAEYKEQVRRQVEEAKWLISALEQRQSTLLKVARRIVHYQRDFLEFGPHYLKPLKMQEIADDIGVHVSTISRATSEKYMQTHRGIFSMKMFFTGATTNIDGGVESRSSVRQRVKEMIDQEDRKSPMSDEDIVFKLRENFGIDVARRTVTKYRKALRIPSARQRRVFR